MFTHDAGAPPQDNPCQQASDKGVANPDPCGRQAVFPSELPCVSDEYNRGKIGCAVGKGGKPWPDSPAAKDKIIDIGGAPDWWRDAWNRTRLQS